MSTADPADTKFFEVRRALFEQQRALAGEIAGNILYDTQAELAYPRNRDKTQTRSWSEILSGATFDLDGGSQAYAASKDEMTEPVSAEAVSNPKNAFKF